MHQQVPHQLSQPRPAMPPQAHGAAPPRRRVFPWIFLGLQVVMFLILALTTGGGPGPDCTGVCASAAQTAQGQNLLDCLTAWGAVDVIVFTCWASWKAPR